MDQTQAQGAAPRPEEPAEGIARRTITMMIDDVAEAVRKGRAAAAGSDAADRTARESEAAGEALSKTVFAAAEGIEVRSDFVDMHELRDCGWNLKEVGVDEARITLRGRNRVQLLCGRAGEKFVFERASAVEYGHVGTAEPPEGGHGACDAWVSQLLSLYELCETPVL